jgi:hypothetical protein
MGAPKGAVAVAEVPYWHLLQEKGMLSVNTWLLCTYYTCYTYNTCSTYTITKIMVAAYEWGYLATYFNVWRVQLVFISVIRPPRYGIKRTISVRGNGHIASPQCRDAKGFRYHISYTLYICSPRCPIQDKKVSAIETYLSTLYTLLGTHPILQVLHPTNGEIDSPVYAIEVLLLLYVRHLL